MNKVVNETCCSCCCHSSVCKLKDQLLTIQSKVNELFRENARSIDSETSYFICPRISCIAYKQTDNQVPKSGDAAMHTVNTINDPFMHPCILESKRWRAL